MGGSRYVIGALLAVLGLWVLVTGRCRRVLAILVGAFVLNPVLETALKELVGRSRPVEFQLAMPAGPSFPSGHVLATVGFYGVLAVVAWKSSLHRPFRVASFGLATSVILGVGFSRVFLGAHWFFDVVGGFLIGTVYVLATAALFGEHSLGSRDPCTAFGTRRYRRPARETVWGPEPGGRQPTAGSE